MKYEHDALCMVQFDLLPTLPGNPRDKSSPSGPGLGGGAN